MSDGLTRRALLAGSAAALAGYALAKRSRRRVVEGVRIGRQDGALGIAFFRDGVRAVVPDRSANGTVNFWHLRDRRITHSLRPGCRLTHWRLSDQV